MVIGFCSVRLLHIPVLSMGPEVRVDGWRWQWGACVTLRLSLLGAGAGVNTWRGLTHLLLTQAQRAGSASLVLQMTKLRHRVLSDFPKRTQRVNDRAGSGRQAGRLYLELLYHPDLETVAVRVSERAQWVKAIAIRPENQSSIPRTHMMTHFKRVNSCKLPLISTWELWHTCALPPVRQINRKNANHHYFVYMCTCSHLCILDVKARG